MTSQDKLSQRAAALVATIFGRSVVPLYFRADLTLEEQIHQRGKPLPYLRVLSQLVSEFRFKTIVEIGSARMPMRHALNAFDPVCCNDGHSTSFLAAYRAASPKLSPQCLVQIDDTDISNGGKGRLVIPQMIRDGFELVTWGRQAILVRD